MLKQLEQLELELQQQILRQQMKQFGRSEAELGTQLGKQCQTEGWIERKMIVGWNWKKNLILDG
jgi:hypothetical protein